MNDRDKELSLAIDALNDLLCEVWEAVPDVDLIRDCANVALAHVENASEMPRPSRIRQLVQRVRQAA